MGQVRNNYALEESRGRFVSGAVSRVAAMIPLYVPSSVKIYRDYVGLASQYDIESQSRIRIPSF